MKSRILLFIVLGGLGITALFFFKIGKAHWQLITPLASTWQLDIVAGKIFESGQEKEYIVAEILLELLEAPGFDRACFMAPSNMKFRAELNGAEIISKNDFTFWPTSFSGKQLRYIPYYDVQPNVLDAKQMATILNSGSNVLRIFFHPNDTALVRSEFFGLAIYTRKQHKGWRPMYLPDEEKNVESDLPVLRITIPHLDIPPDEKTEGKLNITNTADDDSYNISMESRGKTSLDTEKKSFSISIKNGAQPFCGLPKGKDWILYGGWYDLSHIRNMLAFELGRKQGHYEPASRVVELVINNNYRGIYVLMEKPQLSPTRLLSRSGAESPEDFLILTDRLDSGDVTLKSVYWTYILKSKSNLPDSVYHSSVVEKLNCFEGNIYYGERAPCFDVESFVDFVLVQELSANADAFRLSSYFHAFGSGNDTLVKAGPLWDFDLAFHPVADTTTWMLNRNKDKPAYWHQLFSYPPFFESCCNRYSELRETFWSDRSLETTIDSLAALSANVREKNYRVFPFPKDSFWPYENVPASYDEEIANLKKRITERAKWMDEQLNLPKHRDEDAQEYDGRKKRLVYENFN